MATSSERALRSVSASRVAPKSKKRSRDSLETILGVDLPLTSSRDSATNGTSNSAPLDLTLSPQRALASPDFPGVVPLQSPLASALSLNPSPAPGPPSRKRRRRKSSDLNVGSNLSTSNAPTSARTSTSAKPSNAKHKVTGAKSGASGATMSNSTSSNNSSSAHTSSGRGGRGRRSTRRQRVPRGLGGFSGFGGGRSSSLADETEVFVLGDPSGVGGHGHGAFGAAGRAPQQQQRDGVVYQFSDYGSWNDMLPHASQAIEKVRLAGQTSVRLTAMGRPYLYDLTSMMQTNEQTQVQRPIRRIERAPPEKPKSDVPQDEHKMADVTADELWVRVQLTEEQIKTEQCSLCMEDFRENSDAGRLRDCSGHYFHTDCGLGMTTAEYVLDKKKCPVCGTFYGTLIGNCPDGIMRVRPTLSPVPGHNCERAWEVQFSFPGGVQSDKHPNPGSQLHPDSRVAYLPDTEDGREVLELFKRGWKQRILYTVGYSQTRQIDGVIIYNGIHMKTQVSGGMHGYPDKGYLLRVKEEFAVKGVLPPRKENAAETASEEQDDDRMIDIYT